MRSPSFRFFSVHFFSPDRFLLNGKGKSFPFFGFLHKSEQFFVDSPKFLYRKTLSTQDDIVDINRDTTSVTAA